MRSPLRSHHEAGFTLVELLVAIAVAGLTGSILSGLVIFVEHARAEAIRRGNEREGSFVLERTIRLLIEGAPPFVPGNPLGSAVSGNENEVSVTSTGLPIMSLPQAATFRLRREPAASGSDVVLLWTDDTGQVQRTVLAHGVTEMTLAYLPYGANRLPDESVRKGRWYSQWRVERGRLSALRVAFRFGPASTSRVLMFSIEADFPAACLRNPQQGSCAHVGSRS